MRALMLLVLVLITAPLAAQDAKPDTSRGDKLIAAYFKSETEKLAHRSLSEIKTLDDWNAKKDQYRRELFDMLGLDPLPAKSELHATTTGKVEHDEFTVEKVHYQSRPKLYVTGNRPFNGSDPS